MKTIKLKQYRIDVMYSFIGERSYVVEKRHVMSDWKPIKECRTLEYAREIIDRDKVGIIRKWLQRNKKKNDSN